MQDSYLSDDSIEDQNNKKNHILTPQQKVYGEQVLFMTDFVKRVQQIQLSIQSVLIALTNYQQGEQKRLPYSVLRSLEQATKQTKSLKSEIHQKNSYLKNLYENRDKQKDQSNLLFKTFLKHLGETKQQLKQYINKVQTRVRKLQDSGYAQYIEFDVILPEVYSIRLSFGTKTLLFLIQARQQYRDKIMQEIKNRTQMEAINKKDNSQESKKQQNKIALLNNTKISLFHAIEIFNTYKYFQNSNSFTLKTLQLRNLCQQHRQTIKTLQQSIKTLDQTLYKQKLRVGFLSQNPEMTKTDYLIYFKQIQKDIANKVNQTIFKNSQSLNKKTKRSHSI